MARLDLWRKPLVTYISFAICTGLSLLWWFYIPLPDMPFLAMGVGALVVTLRGVMTSREKSLWLAAFCFFAAVEMRALRESEKNQAEAFAAIGAGITASIEKNDQHFTETMGKLSDVLSATNTNLQELTGGNSFVYFMPSEPTIVSRDKDVFCSLGFPVLVGEFPLHDVVVSGQDPVTGQPWIENQGTIYPKELGKPRQGKSFLFKDDIKTPVNVHVDITTSNGSYFEQIQLQKNGNKWERALHLTKATDKGQRLVYDWKDKGYPAKQIDWNKL